MSYKCLKCSGGDYTKSEVSTTGGTWSRMFDYSSNFFTAITCSKCGYTELFRANSTGLKDLLDGLGSI
jgi:uncharacterized protein